MNTRLRNRNNRDAREQGASFDGLAVLSEPVCKCEPVEEANGEKGEAFTEKPVYRREGRGPGQPSGVALPLEQR